MRPGTKFLLGATVIVAGVTGLIVTGVKEAGQYLMTPTQLVMRTRTDPTFHDVGLKVGAKVVRGSVHRQARTIDFLISDGTSEFPVTYTGIVPDTFTDANDIEVIVEGKYGRDGVFHATEVLAKCGSRYEAEIQKTKKA